MRTRLTIVLPPDPYTYRPSILSHPSYDHSPPSPAKRLFDPDPHAHRSTGPEPTRQPYTPYPPPATPYSPPPTAEPSRARTPFKPITHREDVREETQRQSPELPKSSHLPPTLAAIALTRPVDAGGSSSTLPSLDRSAPADLLRPISADPEARERPPLQSTSSTGALPSLSTLFK